MEIHSVTCYPQPCKAKAQRVCEAFAAGCGGAVSGITPQLGPGAAMFYGVRQPWQHLWAQAKAEGRDWYYADNAYFDGARERYFRVTRNAIQHGGAGASDGRRARMHPLMPQVWQRAGREILICRQSDEFMRVVGRPGWFAETCAALRRVTDRPVVVRGKDDSTPLQEALRSAWAVVTWSSASAVEAVLAGVPVVCDPACAAWPFSTPLEEIEKPRRLEGRTRWAAVLADNQWTLDEMRDGTAWRMLHG